jgi:multisubunit Na+/H+ antiporter MnhG subunit
MAWLAIGTTVLPDDQLTVYASVICFFFRHASGCLYVQACVLIVAALALVNTSTAHTVNRALLQQGGLAQHLVDLANSVYIGS